MNRARAFQSLGLMVLGAALLANADVRPATTCADPVFASCIDYGGRWNAPSALAGVGLLAVGAGLLWWALGTHALGTLLRAAFLVALAGALLLAFAWSWGVRETCVTTSTSGSEPVPQPTRCETHVEPWYASTLVAGGALVGAGVVASGLLLGLRPTGKAA